MPRVAHDVALAGWRLPHHSVVDVELRVLDSGWQLQGQRARAARAI